MPTIHELLTASLTHQLAGRLAEAERGYREVLSLDPSCAKAWHFLGLVAFQTGRHDSAGKFITKAIEIMPNYAEAYSNLGNVCLAEGKVSESLLNYDKAIELQPDYAEAYSNKGVVFRDLGDNNQAIYFFRRTVKLKPDHFQAHVNLGAALQEELRFDEAAIAYEQAIHLNPASAEAHCNYAFVKLAQGDLSEGWEEYEWRWKLGKLSPRDFPQPLWDGSALTGQTILIHAEQGLGDTIQFIRFALLLKARGGNVIVQCQPPLRQLLHHTPGIHRFIGVGDPLPAFDVHIPLLSLPRIFGTTLETIPAGIPYLFADSSLVQHWQATLATLRGFRIGINWKGRDDIVEYRQRNIPLELFASLADSSLIQLISLQRGPGRDELLAANLPIPIMDLGDEIDTARGPFMDTAAIIKNLDLVITSDSVIAHLAGAVGTPVWLALPYFPDWRWLLDRSDSPWYPTMRLFRQKFPGDWAGVFAEIKAALRERHPTV
jgi:tetratricopeptide (TPR) repeat protein